MRKLVWLISGVAIGFVAAHYVNQSPEGRRFFEEIEQGRREFADAVSRGYHNRGAELGSALNDVEHALNNLNR
ncbi:hypothetical protein GCM10022198_05360 [Klugiella xanthotipulae]|uniref:Uncharacterized protein n=1 Tax=Klugiella xanthotipulae TaxID=244735 RepID=A0A543HSG2_9MICO|nr:hypothetical protein [Klugiella xanthotipulae]TQM61209.1 hypothetical protein FB466_2150 [Klugiella xanthotipulae]